MPQVRYPESRIKTSGTRRSPPYISFLRFRIFIETLSASRTVPPQIDFADLPGPSASAKSQLMSALRYLHLTDTAGRSTDGLHRLVTACHTPDWRPALASLVRNAYPVLCELDLRTMEPNNLDAKFKDIWGIDGGRRVKCRTFFLHAQREAGVPLSDSILRTLKHRTRSALRRSSVPPANLHASASTPPLAEEDGSTQSTPLSVDQFVLAARLAIDKRLTLQERDVVWAMLGHCRQS